MRFPAAATVLSIVVGITHIACKPNDNAPPPTTLAVTASAPHTVPRRNTVTLTGRANLPAAFAWRQTSGPPVSIQDGNARVASFVAPELEADLVFEVRATSANGFATAATTVQVRNQAPSVSSLSFTPARPLAPDAIAVVAVVDDPDRDVLDVSYAWKRNGTPIPGAAGAVLPGRSTRPGDVVTAVVSVSDGALGANAELSATVEDAPFTLTAVPPDRATLGTAVRFVVAAVSDEDRVPGPFVLDHGPAGMTVAADGTVSWTAALPIFDEALYVHWSVSLADFPANHLAGTIRVEAPGHQVRLVYGPAIPRGPGAFLVRDLDGDGRVEVLIASSWSPQYPGVAEWAFTGGALVQRWAQPFPLGVAAALAAEDLDGDGWAELFIGLEEGAIVRLDGRTRRESVRFQLDPGDSCIALSIADLDADGRPELLCLAVPPNSFGYPARVEALDAETFARRWQSPYLSLGPGLAVGRVTAAPTRQVVTSGGYVFEGATGVTQWAFAPGFGEFVGVGDLDGDGIDEIVGAGGTRVRAFSVAAQAALWDVEETVFPLGALALALADLDGDGRAEIILSTPYPPDVGAFRYQAATASLELAARVTSPTSRGPFAIAAGDLDGDGVPEMVWAFGAGITGPDSLVIAGHPPAWTVEWTNRDPYLLDGPFLGARPARLASGTTRVLFGVPTSDAGYGGFRIASLDPATGALTCSPELGSNWAGVGDLDAADVDGDGVDEAFISTAQTYTPYLAVVDVEGGIEKWRSGPLPPAAALRYGDVTGDGTADLVALLDLGTTSELYLFDVRERALAGDVSGLPYGGVVHPIDLDGDGIAEIVTLVENRLTVYALRGTPPASVAVASIPVASGYDLAVCDCDGDGEAEIYVLFGFLSPTSSVERYDSALRKTGGFAFDVPAVTLHVEDLGTDRKNLLLGVGGVSWSTEPPSLRAVDATSGAEIWRSPAFWSLPIRGSVAYVDVGGVRQLVFGTPVGIYLTR